MQLKKMLAMAVVTAMAATVCAPAMAETATPGGIARTKAGEIKNLASDWTANKTDLIDAATEMTKQLSDPKAKATINQEMGNAGLAFFAAAEKNHATEVDSDDNAYNKDDVQVKYSKEANADALTVSSCTVDENGTVTLDADPGQDVSEYGYTIVIVLPDDAEATGYQITMTGADAQTMDMVAPVQYSYDEVAGKEIKQLSFWVPHFTTYELSPVTVSDSTENKPTSNPTVTVSNEDNSGESTTAQATPAPVVAENPIKKTGTSMNLSMMAVVAVAAVAACGAGVAVKKNRKGE